MAFVLIPLRVVATAGLSLARGAGGGIGGLGRSSAMGRRRGGGGGGLSFGGGGGGGMNYSVRVHGLNELIRDFHAMEKDARTFARQELAAVAEPVAATARDLISVYQGAKLATIQPKLGRGNVIYVQQGARKVTGQRGDFGALQLRRLGEALDSNEDRVVRALDEALGRLARSHGF